MGPEDGENYVCEGKVAGFFKYHGCELVCPDLEDPLEEVFIDGNTTGDGEIPFPPEEDPTEGEPEGADVHTCCDPLIGGGGGPGAVEGAEACLSACGHAACNEAISRFEAMLAETDPDKQVWKKCPGQTCRDNVWSSLEHFITFTKANFGKCVAAALDPGAGNEFKFDDPSCIENTPSVDRIGCLIHAQLDLSCDSVTIDFDSNFGTCTEAMHQPPDPPTSQACTIDVGGGEVSDAAGIESADFTGGSAVTRYLDCGESLCPFILDGLQVTIEDIEGGGVELSDARRGSRRISRRTALLASAAARLRAPRACRRARRAAS